MRIDRVSKGWLISLTVAALAAAALAAPGRLRAQGGEHAARIESPSKQTQTGILFSETAVGTPAPIATPLIWQPPTRTPRPTLTPGGPTATPRAAAIDADSPFRPERLQKAALSGVGIGLGAFGLLAIYGLIRAASRGELRVWWWEFRREVINPLFRRSRRQPEK